jgi:hypothetical protein
MLEIAAVSRETVASMTVHARAILPRCVPYRPGNFYREINMMDIVKRTANSADNSMSTSHSDMTTPLVAALNSLLILNNTPPQQMVNAANVKIEKETPVFGMPPSPFSGVVYV